MCPFDSQVEVTTILREAFLDQKLKLPEHNIFFSYQQTHLYPWLIGVLVY